MSYQILFLVGYLADDALVNDEKAKQAETVE